LGKTKANSRRTNNQDGYFISFYNIINYQMYHDIESTVANHL